MSRKGEMREGGWVHPQGANGVAQSWAGCRKHSLGAGWAICSTASNSNFHGCFFGLKWVDIAHADTH